MKTRLTMLWILPLIAFLAGDAQTSAPLRLVQTIPLPNVEGYFDHMAIDLQGHRLFVPGEYQRTLEVVDLRAARVIHTIKDFGGNPRKTVYLPERNQLWVDSGDGTCKVFDAKSYQLVKNIPLSGSNLDEQSRLTPDNAAYDPASQTFYIADRAETDKAGPNGSIEIVSTRTGTYEGSIPVKGAKPEAVVLDPATPKMFVPVSTTNEVDVIDRQKRTVVATWPITGGPIPHAAALDAAHHRLFIGSRVQPGHLYKPGKMVVMDSETGKVIAALDTEGGPDELDFDPESQRIYLTGASGAVDVFKELDPDHYVLLGQTTTGYIAKTSLLVPELKQLFVAVPKHVVLTPPIPQSQEAVIEPAKLLVFAVLQ